MLYSVKEISQVFGEALKMGAAGFSESSVNIYQPTNKQTINQSPWPQSASELTDRASAVFQQS
jgi:hypothetical protein